MAVKAPNDRLVVGKIVGAFGIKGWLKVKSFTSPEKNIVAYSPWRLIPSAKGLAKVGQQKAALKLQEHYECDAHNLRPQGLVVHLKGIDDRNLAEALVGLEIEADASLLPSLDAGEYYWHQLIGLQVVTEFEGQVAALGLVTGLMETGANDVLVVKGKGGDQSLDQRERLIPYVPEQYVKKIDLQAQTITVDWDPEF